MLKSLITYFLYSYEKCSTCRAMKEIHVHVSSQFHQEAQTIIILGDLFKPEVGQISIHVHPCHTMYMARGDGKQSQCLN